MSDFRKNILQTDFERKKSCMEIPAIQWLCMSGKKFYHQRFAKKILTQSKSPISPSKVKWSAPYPFRCSLLLVLSPLPERPTNSLCFAFFWKQSAHSRSKLVTKIIICLLFILQREVESDIQPEIWQCLQDLQQLYIFHEANGSVCRPLYVVC